MDELSVQRVLVEYSRIATDLEESEASERAMLLGLQTRTAGLSATQRQELEGREQFQLGRIEGLVEAQLTILVRRQAFARAHRPGAADWHRHRIGRPEPAGGGVSPPAGRDDLGDQGHPPDRTPGP